MNAASAPVAIVGGGVSGLSAAYELSRAGRPWVLLEASGRLGGKIATFRKNVPGVGEFLYEQAADAFIFSKPWALDLAHELGLEAELIHPNTHNKNIYFLRKGELKLFPTGLRMFVPTDDASFLASGVLPRAAAERMLAEENVPPRTNDGDESLAAWVTRRFGAEALDFVAPIAAGIYVANPETLSMQATFPQFLALEDRYGSLRAAYRQLPPAPEYVFVSFKGGVETLISALKTHLDADPSGKICTNSPVESVAFAEADATLRLHSGETLQASRALLSTPAAVTARLLQESHPQAAEKVAELHCNSSGAVVLAYRREQVSHHLGMHGVLVAKSEGLPFSAITLHSSKMNERAPEGAVLMRVFYGQEVPPTAAADAHAFAAELLGIAGEPLFSQVIDWKEQNPAYNLGHLQIIGELQETLPPTAEIFGAQISGVGIPDCVRAGREAARRGLALS